MKHLCYIYVLQYRQFRNVEFSFLPQYKCQYKDGIVTVTDVPSALPENFWGDNIYSLTGIFGNNAAGKTNLMRLILSAISGREWDNHLKAFILFEDSENKEQPLVAYSNINDIAVSYKKAHIDTKYITSVNYDILPKRYEQYNWKGDIIPVEYNGSLKNNCYEKHSFFYFSGHFIPYMNDDDPIVDNTKTDNAETDKSETDKSKADKSETDGLYAYKKHIKLATDRAIIGEKKDNTVDNALHYLNDRIDIDVINFIYKNI